MGPPHGDKCFGLLETKYTNGSSFKKSNGAALWTMGLEARELTRK